MTPQSCFIADLRRSLHQNGCSEINVIHYIYYLQLVEGIMIDYITSLTILYNATM